MGPNAVNDLFDKLDTERPSLRDSDIVGKGCGVRRSEVWSLDLGEVMETYDCFS